MDMNVSFSGSGSLSTALQVILIVALVCLFVFYIVTGILINIASKKKTGKGTILGFVPFAQIYKLGEMSFDKTVGIVLLVVPFCIGLLSNIVPDSIYKILTGIDSILCLVCFIKLIIVIASDDSKQTNEVVQNTTSAMPQVESSKPIENNSNQYTAVSNNITNVEPVINVEPQVEETIKVTEAEEPVVEITEPVVNLSNIQPMSFDKSVVEPVASNLVQPVTEPVVEQITEPVVEPVIKIDDQPPVVTDDTNLI